MPSQNRIGTHLIGKKYLSESVFTKIVFICFITLKKISDFENRSICSKNLRGNTG